MTWLDEVKARLAAATPGCWLTGYPNAGDITPMPGHVWSENKDLISKDICDDRDAEFIAHSPTDIARLLAVVDKLREQRDAMTEVLCNVTGRTVVKNGDAELLAILKGGE